MSENLSGLKEIISDIDVITDKMDELKQKISFVIDEILNNCDKRIKNNERVDDIYTELRVFEKCLITRNIDGIDVYIKAYIRLKGFFDIDGNV